MAESADSKFPNGALGLSEAYCGQQTFTSQKDKQQPWWVAEVKYVWMEPAVVRTEPWQGNPSPLTNTLITVSLCLPLCSQASWESYSHSFSSLPHLLSALPASCCSQQPSETFVVHVTAALLGVENSSLLLLDLSAMFDTVNHS